LGGVGTSSSKNVGINNTKPDGKIASGLFLLWQLLAGIAKFNNKMRLAGQNSNFFKMTILRKEMRQLLLKASAWLNIYNAEGAFKQILVGIWTLLMRTILFDGTF
jgi:hypothetical protein